MEVSDCVILSDVVLKQLFGLLKVIFNVGDFIFDALLHLVQLLVVNPAADV